MVKLINRPTMAGTVVSAKGPSESGNADILKIANCVKFQETYRLYIRSEWESHGPFLRDILFCTSTESAWMATLGKKLARCVLNTAGCRCKTRTNSWLEYEKYKT